MSLGPATTRPSIAMTTCSAAQNRRAFQAFSRGEQDNSRPRFHRPTVEIPFPPECRELIHQGALVAVSSSGGKDSQAMTILLSGIVPAKQMIVVHAPLGEAEWPGTIEHIEATLPRGVPLILAPVASGKSLLDRVEERGKFPGIQQRWCTGDYKRTPIERELRRYLGANSRFNGRLVNCLGIRRDESSARARRVPWQRNDRMSVAGREVFDWLPIFDLSTEDVFRVRRQHCYPHQPVPPSRP